MRPRTRGRTSRSSHQPFANIALMTDLGQMLWFKKNDFAQKFCEKLAFFN
jgi:hypothetical protein